MAKSIHWPAPFLEEVLAEDDKTLRCAFRLGRLYYDEPYWAPDEIVDIRVNHEIVRQAVVVGSLKCCPIRELTLSDLSMQKKLLQTASNVIAYLRETYKQPVDDMTEITVVYYRNL